MDKLYVLWTTDNKDTVFSMLSMYAINAKKRAWWESITIIIWGASAKLIATDTQVQTEVVEMINAGIQVEACHACCDSFGVTDTIRKLGVDVRYMGESLTAYLKSDHKILTV